MKEEDLIELITNWFDENTDLHLASTVSEVFEHFKTVEQFLADNEIDLEHEVSEDEFVDVKVSNPIVDDNDETEVKFELPLLFKGEPVELMLEFYYQQLSEGSYGIWVDVDFYVDSEDSDD